MKKNEQGFTLLEMMIVLLVISVLLLVTIPSIAKHNSSINTKGCEAYVNMLEAQVQAFEIDKGRLPENIEELITENYLKAGQEKCPHGISMEIGENGEIIRNHESTE